MLLRLTSTISAGTRSRYQPPFSRFLAWAEERGTVWFDFQQPALAELLASYVATCDRRAAEDAVKSVGTFFDALCDLTPGSIAQSRPVRGVLKAIRLDDPPPPADAEVPSVAPLVQALRQPVDLSALPFSALHDRCLVLAVLHTMLRPAQLREALRDGGFELTESHLFFRCRGVKTASRRAVSELHRVYALPESHKGLCLVRALLVYDRRIGDPSRTNLFVRIGEGGEYEAGLGNSDTFSNRINVFMRSISPLYGQVKARLLSKMAVTFMVELGHDVKEVGADRWRAGSAVPERHYVGAGAVAGLARKRALSEV